MLIKKKKLRNFEDVQLLTNLTDQDEIKLPLAIALLLTDIALIDGHFDQSEYSFIFDRLENKLGLSHNEAKEIVDQARLTLSSGRGASNMAEYVKTNFTLDQRKQIYEFIKGMVRADGMVDGYEEYLSKRFAGFLGVN